MDFLQKYESILRNNINIPSPSNQKNLPEEPSKRVSPWRLRNDRWSLSATTVAGEKSVIGKIAHGQIHGLLQALKATWFPEAGWPHCYLLRLQGNQTAD
jgi:hypothetical protein